MLRNLVKSLSLLKALTFILFTTGTVLPFIGFFTPVSYLAPYALQHGSSLTDAQFLMTITSVTTSLGCVLIGAFIDQSQPDVVLVYNISLIACGLVTCLVPLIHSYELICVYAASLGLVMGVFLSLRSLVLIELFGLGNLTSSLGLLVFCHGFVSLLGSTLSGVVLKLSSSFTVLFPVAGILILSGGAVCLPIRRVALWEINKLYTNMAAKTPPLSDVTQKLVAL